MGSDLGTLFPDGNSDNSLILSDGRVVTMCPLPVRRYAKLTSLMLRLSKQVIEKTPFEDVIEQMTEQLLGLAIPQIEGITEEELALSDAPIVIQKFISLNLGRDTLGKSVGLARLLTGLLPDPR